MNNDGADETRQALGPEHYHKLESAIQYNFKEGAWLVKALTHRSAPLKKTTDNGTVQQRYDYERLEFLGDAVLDLAIAHLLSDTHPNAKEGELSKMRAALVNTESLASIGREINLGEFIKLGAGEMSSASFNRPSILADVVEAVVGAVYRDSGYDTALEIAKQLFGEKVKSVKPHDPKTELQELLHAIGGEPPEYLLESMQGPEHEPTFVSVVKVKTDIIGRGQGSTKKASQQKAAKEALEKLQEKPELTNEKNSQKESLEGIK